MKKWIIFYRDGILRLARVLKNKKIHFHHRHYQLNTFIMNNKLEKSYQTLHENNIGKVTKCNCCGKLQILLGTTLMTIAQQEFDSCFISLNKLAADLEKTDHIQTIYLRTPSDDVFISLSQKQFFEAVDLLKGASVLLEINEILH